MNSASAGSAATNYQRARPSNCSGWFLGSLNQWYQIMGSFSSPSLKDKFGTVGGTNLYSNSYWTSSNGTENSSYTKSYSFASNKVFEGNSTQTAYVRAFFAFQVIGDKEECRLKESTWGGSDYCN